MSLLKDLTDLSESRKLLQLLERHCRATERIADTLEALLPSPLTRLDHRDLKPPGVESFKVYGDKEAYWEEVNQRKGKIERELEDANYS